jgi:hypothetical protein
MSLVHDVFFQWRSWFVARLVAVRTATFARGATLS